MIPKIPKNFNLDKSLERLVSHLHSNYHLCRADYCILLIMRNEIPMKKKIEKLWEDMTKSEKDLIVSNYNRKFGPGCWSNFSKNIDFTKKKFFFWQEDSKFRDKFEMHSFEDGLCRLFDLEKFGYVIDQLNHSETESIYYIKDGWWMPSGFPEQPKEDMCLVIGMHKGETPDDSNITPDLIERISNSVIP